MRITWTGVGCAVMAVAVAYAWMTEPAASAPGVTYAVATPEGLPDRGRAGALCRQVESGETDIAVPFGISYTLSIFAQQYAAEPTPGAAYQVLAECRRLDLL